jgi:hypothetical protein
VYLASQVTMLYFASASDVHKVNLYPVDKAKKLCSSKEHHRQICQSLWKAAWMHSILKTLFDCILVLEHFKSRSLLEKAVLLRNNAPSHLKMFLNQTGQICVKYLISDLAA